jgi:hypothetical protein
MRTIPRASRAALSALFVGLAHCSLLAPSDAELMGGKSNGDASADDGASDAGDAADALPDGDRGDAACRATAETCTVDGDCCSAFCNAGKCVDCIAAGFFCNGAVTRCCSHTCNAGGGHKCD